MISILLKSNDRLTVTNNERIMHRSKLVNTLRFVVEPTYNGMDASVFDVSLQYVLPNSKEAHYVGLTLDEERTSDGFLTYTIDMDTDITKEVGKIKLWLTAVWVEMLADGTTRQHVRKTSPCFLEVLPISTWANIIPDEALDAIDQRLIMNNAQLNAIQDLLNADLSGSSTNSFANGLFYDDMTNELQLTSNGVPIGNTVDLTELENADGIPAVVFSASEPSENEDGFEVVEF